MMAARLHSALLFATAAASGASWVSFVHIPKNGGTKVAAMLRNAGLKVAHQNKAPLNISCSARHLPPRYDATRSNTTTSFAVLRHPYERIISEWNWGRAGVWTPKLGYEASGAGMNAWIADSLRNATSEGAEPTRRLVKEPLFQATRGGPFHGDCHWLPQSSYVFDASGRRLVDVLFCLGNQVLATQIADFVGVRLRAEASLEGMIANGSRTRTTVGALADRRKCHGKCERFVQLTDEVLAAANAFYREDFERFGFSRATTARDIAVDVLEFHPAGKRYPQVRHTIHHDDWGRRAWCHGAV